MHQLARSLGRKITFKVYLDSEHVPATVRSQLSSAGLEVVDCPHDGMKEVVDKSIIGMHKLEISSLKNLLINTDLSVDTLLYALDNPAPGSLVLISGDRGYAQMLSKLALRGYHVVVVAPAVAQAGLRLAQCHEMYEWSDQLAPLSVRSPLNDT